MKRFVRTLILFLVPMVAIIAVGEAVVRSCPNSYRYKHEWMQAHAPGVKTLVLGASHAYAGIKPDLLGDSAFNLANVSQHYEHDWFLLSQYGPQLTALKTVVLTIDDCMPFEGPLEDAIESYRATYYRLYMGHDKHSFFSPYGMELFSPHQFRAKLDRVIYGNKSLDCDSLGWGTTFINHARFNEHAMRVSAQRSKENHKSHNRSDIDNNIKYINNIGAWCRGHNVRLVLVTTPLWSGYVDILEPWKKNMIDSIGRTTAQRYGATYINYMDDTRFEGLDFYDADHLAARGAEKFSRLLKKEAQL